MQMGALTWTEEAIAAGKLDERSGDRRRSRRRARAMACRKGAKFVKPEAEGPLVAAVRRRAQLVYANKYRRGAQGARRGREEVARRAWRSSPSAATSRCARAQIESARAACSKALATDPNESWALYLSGVIAFKDTSASGTKTGIEKLKRAIAVDPDLGQAWRTLAKAYERAKDKAALEKLAADYATKFGTPLPDR